MLSDLLPARKELPTFRRRFSRGVDSDYRALLFRETVPFLSFSLVAVRCF